MNGNKPTMQYLVDQRERVRTQTEAMKKIAKATAKSVALILLGFSIVCGIGVFGLVKANAWWAENMFIFKLPIEVSYKINRWYQVVRRVPSMVKVAVTDDSLLDEDIIVTDYGEIAKRTGNPEAALFTIGMFKDAKEGATEIVATFMAESGFRNEAKNWNCIYYENGKPYSGVCAEADRGLAWSVDCGIAQLSFKGTECPAEASNPVWNITMAKAKYDRQGIKAWVAYGGELFDRQLAMLIDSK